MLHISVTINCLSCMPFLLIAIILQVKEEAQQLALIFETVGAFKVKRKGGKGRQIFGT